MPGPLPATIQGAGIVDAATSPVDASPPLDLRSPPPGAVKPQPKLLDLEISSEPRGVTVRVNGALACKQTPCKVRFKGGGPFVVRLADENQHLRPEQLTFPSMDNLRARSRELALVVLNLRL